ncbi:hypothetical protein LTR95_006657 [Oleoguttula sp. CCFEE 5521]
MGSVYARSTGNLIHLSDNQAMGTRIVRLLDKIDIELRGSTRDYKSWRTMIYNKNGSLAYSNSDYQDDIDREAVQFLISIPWFSQARRLWIVQEARLSPSNMCHLGTECFPLAPLLRIITWLVSRSQLNRLSSPISTRGRDCVLVLADLADTEQGWWRYFSPSLANLIMLTRPFEKSEPRDGIYALLGISQASQRGTDEIEPDYRKSVEEIERETTRYMIRQRRDLWALRDVSHPTQGPSGCSWTIRVGGDPQTSGRPLVPSMLDFEAFGDHQDAWGWGPHYKHPNTIELCGLRLDQVVEASEICHRSDLQHSDALQSWMVIAATDLGLTKVRNVDGRLVLTEDDVLSLSCAMMAEEAKSGDKATAEDIDLGVWAMNAMLDDDHLASDPDGSRKTVRKATAEASKHCKWDALIDRRLFKMQSGACGLGPSAMRAGDIVTALRGSPWPAILRPYNEDYQFIGLAYARGLMYGETISALRAAGVEEQWFVVH